MITATSPDRSDTTPGPSLTHLFSMQSELNPSLDAGDGPQGRRILNSAMRGSFAGAKLRGELIPGSGDWMLVRRDGVMVVDARVTLKTEDGAIIHMSYGGRIVIPGELLEAARDKERRHLIDPAHYYFRTSPIFETGARDYAWLNSIVCVGSGRLTRNGVAYDVFQVL
jgi:hypothetical protein